jgi:hypothetical protein
MEFQIERYGITMQMVASEVTDEKVDMSEFKVESGYEKKPFDYIEKILQSLNPLQPSTTSDTASVAPSDSVNSQSSQVIKN